MDIFEQYASSGMGELRGYLSAFEEAPDPMNQGLFAAENLRSKSSQVFETGPLSPRQMGLGDGVGFAGVPTLWFSLVAAQAAVKAGKDRTMKDVSGGEVVVLGKKRAIGKRTLKAGDQFFWQPATREVEAVRTFTQLKSGTGPKSLSEQAVAAQAKPGAPKTPAPQGKTTPAPKIGLVRASVAEIQAILIRIGYPKTKISDGLWGPTTQRYWMEATDRRDLDSMITRAAANLAWVVPSTLEAMRTAQSIPTKTKAAPSSVPTKTKAVIPPASSKAPRPVAVPTPQPQTGAAPAPKGLARAKVAELQQILVRIGYRKTKALSDGLWGPTTAKFWKEATARRKLDTTIRRSSAKEAIVHAKTLAVMRTTKSIPVKKSPAKKTATVKKTLPQKKGRPTDPGKPGMVKTNVGTLQDVLIALGQKKALGKAGRDGLYGPSTAKAWSGAASRRKLDGSINRAAPTEAWVMPKTFEALSTLAFGKKAAPKGQPQPAGMPISKKVVKGLVDIPLNLVNEIRVAFGEPAPAKSADIVTMWKKLATQRKLDPAAQIIGAQFKAVQETFDTLLKEARLRQGTAEVLKHANALIPVFDLQKTLFFENQTKANKGRFSKVRLSKIWDTATENAFFVFFNIPSNQTPFWERAFPKLLSADKKNVKLLPGFVTTILQGSKNYDKYKNQLVKAEQAKKKAAEEKSKDEALLQNLVNHASTLVDILAVQQALNQVIYLQNKGAKTAFGKLADVPLTGTWNPATAAALKKTSLTQITEDHPRAWDVLVKRLLVKTGSSSGVAGLYAHFGDLAAPTGANFIKLPPAVAQNISKLAADFVARKAGIQQPEPGTPEPKSKAQVQGAAQEVRGRVPAPKPVSKKAPKKPAKKTVLGPAIPVRGQAPVPTTAGGAEVGPATTTAGGAEIGPTTAGGAEIGPTTAGGGGGAEVGPATTTAGGGGGAEVGPATTTAGGASVTGPSVTGPTITVSTGGAPSSSSTGLLIAAGAGLAAFALILASQKPKAKKMRRQQAA